MLDMFRRNYNTCSGFIYVWHSHFCPIRRLLLVGVPVRNLISAIKRQNDCTVLVEPLHDLRCVLFKLTRAQHNIIMQCVNNPVAGFTQRRALFNRAHKKRVLL